MSDDVAASVEDLEQSVDVLEVSEADGVDVVAQDGPVEIQGDEDVMDTLRWAMEADYPKRSALPVSHTHNSKDASMWSVLRKNAGKKLSQVSMPVTFNEPLSALQRICEELENSFLLDQASISDQSHERLLLIGAFAVSMYGCTAYRSGRKPFNPLLGETYDIVLPERGFRFMSEQVSHHPPISVGLAESKHWTLFQEATARTSMRPSSLKIVPDGFIRLKIHSTDETFEWKKVATNVEDVLSGKKWVDHFGKLVVANLNNGDACVVEFSQYSMLRKKRKFDVKGCVYTVASPKQPVASFSGKWTEQIINDQTGEVLWKNELPSEEALQHGFGFSPFACQLNDLPPLDSDMYKRLLHTDSRFRPDQRLLENGDYDAAAKEKLRVEQIQREARAARKISGATYLPRFFRLCRLPVQRPHNMLPVAQSQRPSSIRAEWIYVGGFWRMKAQGNMPSIANLW